MGRRAVNYYAVKNGRRCRIYLTWEECHAQVDGHPGAIFKGFKHKDQAVDFMRGKRPGWAPPKKKSPSRKRYEKMITSVTTGGRVGLDTYAGERPPWEYPTFIRCIQTIDDVIECQI